MLDAIEEVHDRGFIHRDVKAVNLTSLTLYSPTLCSLQTTSTSL